MSDKLSNVTSQQQQELSLMSPSRLVANDAGIVWLDGQKR